MKRLLLITLLIGYIYPCVAQDKPIRTEESLYRPWEMSHSPH